MELYNMLPVDLQHEVDKYLPTKRQIYKQIYRETHKKEIRLSNQKYRQEHPEVVREISRRYYQRHKEEINARKNVKTKCECGGVYALKHRAAHCSTKKHQNWAGQQVD